MEPTLYSRGTKIYRKLLRKRVTPKHLAEVGVYRPQSCNLLDYVEAGIPSTLVEANPKTAEALAAYFRGRDNVTIHPVAVYDREGTIELYERGASTFAGAIDGSPAIINDAYQPTGEDRFVVPAVTFDRIDDGTIDLLSVDVEGCEWFIIKHMISRPDVISLETHGASYVNPYLGDIMAWMQSNNYVPWYKDMSDTVFVKEGSVPITAVDRLLLALVNLRIRMRRFKKKAIRRIFG